jgi:transposase
VLTAANINDITQLLRLVDAIPPVRGRPGRPRRRPDAVVGDRGYDSDLHRRALWHRGIRPELARRGGFLAPRLGQNRWRVERSLSWLHQFRRLRIRWEFRADMHEASLKLACCLICLRRLESSLCWQLYGPGREKGPQSPRALAALEACGFNGELRGKIYFDVGN